MTCRPVGSALPPRRDILVQAADASPAPLSSETDSIIVPAARDRLLELFEREQLPTDVRHTMAGSLGGNIRHQQLLFQAMIDTWPRLQKSLGEVKRAVRKAPWKVQAWAPRGEDPEKGAEKLAREVENAIWSMKPDAARGHLGFERTVEELALGYYLGHHVLEVHWLREDVFRPISTKVVPPRFYGYPYDTPGEDRLMLDRTGEGILSQFEDFPEHRFLLAVNRGHPGHPTVAAPLRALVGYWLAAVYGLKWFLQYAQLYGHRNAQDDGWRLVRLVPGPGRDHILILTNLPLEEVGAWELCEIYKQRWTIELFFRWLKCLLPCRHWLAESEDGVTTQVYCALIAALLLSRRGGKLPTKRMMERLRFWMMGWATDEELAAALGPAKKRN